MMRKMKCVISYDGTNYSGYQIQPNAVTIQETIEQALAKMHSGKMIRIHSSGRTDKGVHAIGQVIHFQTDLQIPPKNWKKALNTLLPDDIYIKQVQEVAENFHARIDAVEKDYRYFVLNKQEPDVFRRNYVHFETERLNLKKIQSACKLIEGTHDFTAFSSARTTVKGSKVRTLFEVSCQRRSDSELVIILKVVSFLYHMVRIIVGVLIDVGKGHVNEAEIKKMFESRDRTQVGVTLPPQGLYLWHVTYENTEMDDE